MGFTSQDTYICHSTVTTKLLLGTAWSQKDSCAADPDYDIPTNNLSRTHISSLIIGVLSKWCHCSYECWQNSELHQFVYEINVTSKYDRNNFKRSISKIMGTWNTLLYSATDYRCYTSLTKRVVFDASEILKIIFQWQNVRLSLCFNNHLFTAEYNVDAFNY